MSVRSDRIDEVYAATISEDREELILELLNLLTLPCLYSLHEDEMSRRALLGQ